MSIYMDDIAAATGIAEMRKGIRNCAKMEMESKMRYGLKKISTIIQEKTKCCTIQNDKWERKQ